MRIAIDMQAIQAASRFHSGVNHAIEFVQSVLRNRGEHEVILVLSGLIPDSIETMRRIFDGLLSPENICVWYTPECLSGNETHRQVAELVREAFIASLRPDVIHICSLFEGWVDDFVVSIGQFDRQTPVTISVFESQSDAHGLKFFCGDSRQCFKTEVISLAAICYVTPEVRKTNDFWCIATDKIREIFLTPQDDLDCSVAHVYADWENLVVDAKKSKDHQMITAYRPRLAFVSPLPPKRSGIADYASELIPFLCEYYDIDIVEDVDGGDSKLTYHHCNIVSLSDFECCGQKYERILYHFGNNPMHVKYFELLDKFPGVVVSHDFFLSGVQWYRETYGFANNALWNELYLSHGYTALKMRKTEGDEKVTLTYPCNFSVLGNALGVVVHSDNSVRLARQWYGVSGDLHVIPLLRKQADLISRQTARHELGLKDSDFLICSFGFIGETKLNHRLLDAWEASSLLHCDKNCKLVFVGESDDSSYAKKLSDRVSKYKKYDAAKISGWVDARTYRLYLAATDVAVQLRSLSRGETSAAVLDCMNYGIATIVNDNGSMADISDDVVCKIPDEFLDSELVTQLECLYLDHEKRKELACRAQKFIHTEHNPKHCAKLYAYSIEYFYHKCSFDLQKLIAALAHPLRSNRDNDFLYELSRLLAINFPRKCASRTLYLDVSVVARDDFKTGIQRVVRALVLALINSPPMGFRIEPVYLNEDPDGWYYYYARNYTSGLLDLPRMLPDDDRMEAQPGDILLGLDLAGGYVVNAERQGVYRDLQNRGIQVSFLVYDLIPVQFDDVYPSGFKEGHVDWLKVVAKSDSAICISKAVAHDLSAWVEKNMPERASRLDVHWFHLGADIDNSRPSFGFPANTDDVVFKLSNSPSFLMVGTVEPRKGHKQVLDAFEELWLEKREVNLVVIGKEGWMIDELTDRLRNHNELNKRLFWLENISDEYLKKIYDISTCLIAASYGEGFGLPLIEAAQHKLPVIARDIPVFREVASKYAFYFVANKPSELAQAVLAWLALYEKGKHVKSDAMPWLTWEESARQLLEALGLKLVSKTSTIKK